MDDNTIKFLGITVACVVIFGFGMSYLKKKRYANLIQLLQAGNFDEFMKMVDGRFTRFLFPGYNLEYLKLNALIIEGNKRKINDQFDKMFKFRLTKKQDEDLSMKGFNYYLGMEDKHRTKELLERILKFNNERMKEEVQMMYDIFMAKSFSYIETMEEQLSEQNEEQRSITEYLLSVQYENAGNKEKAKEYEELYKKDTEIAQKKFEEAHQKK